MKIYVFILFYFAACVCANTIPNCDVTATTDSGTVCGKTRRATNGDLYASFRGMRYAMAPYADLRFANPQKPDPYNGTFDATEHGPICPQVDVIYGPLLQPRSMDEDCLRINVHVPLASFPGSSSNGTSKLLPVFFFIHGGSFSYGSGDTDIHGPEYLLAGNDVISVTFNYRLNVMGFLSLYSKEAPGNMGLRDAIFALEWVQENIRNFGGNPEEVTLGGQSAGGVLAHLISISPAVEGKNLFKRVIALSGAGLAGFYSTTKAYSTTIRTPYLLAAGINPLQPLRSIHRDLTKAPIEKLIKANKIILDVLGLVSFGPVIEDSLDGIIPILPKDPELLVDEGFGKEYPLWLEYTDNEAETYRKRLVEVNLETKFKLLPPLAVPFNILFASKLLAIPTLSRLVREEYFNRTQVTLDKSLPLISDGITKYPTLRLIEKRLSQGADEPIYLSEFSYPADQDIFQAIHGRHWSGAGHCADLFNIFRVNSFLGEDQVNELTQDNSDSRMKSWMRELLVQYVKTGSPVPEGQESQWPPTGKSLMFQNIFTPGQLNFTAATPYLMDKKKFFDRLNKIGRRM